MIPERIETLENNVPYRVEFTYLAHIWEYPPGALPAVLQLFYNVKSLKLLFIGCAKISTNQASAANWASLACVLHVISRLSKSLKTRLQN